MVAETENLAALEQGIPSLVIIRLLKKTFRRKELAIVQSSDANPFWDINAQVETAESVRSPLRVCCFEDRSFADHAKW